MHLVCKYVMQYWNKENWVFLYVLMWQWEQNVKGLDDKVNILGHVESKIR